MNLPQPIADALAPLFEQHPIETMMDKLVVTEKPKPEFVALVDACLRTEALAGRKDLAAGLWL